MSGGEDAIRKAVEGAEVVDFPRRGGGGDDDDFDLRLALLPRNDIGNAKRLIERFGLDLLHVPDIGWHVWAESHWDRRTGERQAQLLAHRTVAAIKDEAKALEDHGPFEEPPEDVEEPAAKSADKEWADFVKGRYAWAIGSGNSGRVSAMLREAAPYQATELEELDADPFMLNVANGTLPLRAAGGVADGKGSGEGGGGDLVLQPHQREHRITKISPARFDPEAEAPIFRRFLDGILPDGEIQTFLQRWFGYCLTGDTSEQCLVLFHGTGANGKSTLVDTVKWILGDYAMTLPFASLLHDDRRRGSEPTPDLARLPGARLVSAAEPEIGQRFSESLIKTLTGGEAITARHLQQGFFEFTPSFKLVLSFNTKPSVRGQDEGIWRRLLMVPFDVTVPKAQRDRDLAEKLRGEASGILNWMLDGLRLWSEGGLQIPAAVRAATAAYKTESDPLGQFMEMATVRRLGAHVQAKQLYTAYTHWCKENAVEPLSMTAVGRKLGDRGIEKERAGVVFYKDLELLEEFKPSSGPPPHDDDDVR